MAKKRYMRDAIHSFISFKKNGVVNQIIDTEEFQRLKYIRQLGLSYFTYPSALHSRFSHSLGVYWLSKRFSNALELTDGDKEKLSLAALLHDIGHGPFSHALENVIIEDKKHKILSKEIIESGEISDILKKYSIKPKDISDLLTSGAVKPKYLHKLISSQTDVDRFDYLLRDSLMSGNPHGRYDLERIIYTMRINDDHEIYIDEGGWNAIEYYLTCRYQMHKQVYFHHTTLSSEELLKKIIQRIKIVYDASELKLEDKFDSLLKADLKLDGFLNLVDFDIFYLIRLAKKFNDPILNDLSSRFFQRKLFKSLKLVGEDIHKIIGKEEGIKSIVKTQGFDPEYYYSFADVGMKRAYMPYSPKPGDKENSIYINEECSKEISQEIPSLKSIQTAATIFLFFPNKQCKESIEKFLK